MKLLVSVPAAMEQLMLLIPAILLLTGGAIFIAAGLRLRDDPLLQRMTLMRLTAGVKSSSAMRELSGERKNNLSAYGLSDAEQRQVVRMLAKFNLSEEQAPGVFTAVRLAVAAFAFICVMIAAPAPALAFNAALGLPAAFIGWLVPALMVKSALKKHRNDVSAGLPDALELLAICVESGLSLDNGLHRVSQELRNSQPALGDELAITWAEISILPSRDQALENFAARVDMPAVRSVVGTLTQSLRYGSPLAQSLRNAAAEMRNEHIVRIEERANRLPAMMTVPVMLLIMPTIFLIVGGPAVLRLMDIFWPAQ